MCGIVGQAGLQRAADPRNLQRAMDALIKRGPDDSGSWVEGATAFGHRRLSIIDLSPNGRQPMSSPDGRYVIVYNGEVYNFLTLRDELAGHWGEWRSQSDTEVILAAYARWGPACLERFHGMFSFAIWDRQTRSLFAARDRMGVKPFYYHADPGSVLFASRPRALFALDPELSREIDVQALRYYLECGYVPAPLSIHTSIRKLEPGHWLRWKDGALEVERYWDSRSIATEAGWRRRSEEDLLDELDEVVSRSVKSRLVSDVPLGAFLSGGIDSTLVVAMMTRFSSSPVETFTIGFSDRRFDESPHARAVADHLGTEHHCETLEVDGLLGLMDTFREEFDEPFYDYSAFPTMALSRSARQHVTVSLSGDGGDELFGGYHYYRYVKMLHLVSGVPAPLRRAGAHALAAIPDHRAKVLSGALRQPSAVAAFAFMRSIAKDFESVLPQSIRSGTNSFAALLQGGAQNLNPRLHPVEVAMRLDSLFTLPEEYLQKLDVASMGFSLESREPLLDHSLVEWAMRLPVEWKLRTRTNKYLLRKLAYRYVPESILDRPKRGFEVPIGDWLRGPLRQWASERCHETKLFEHVPLEQAKVLNLLSLHESGRRNVHPLLWAILMLLDYAAVGF
jgi:asparagine synthase (glutamine-hydrolysing)